ncbi:5-formyltetrahydrofolate cyclo-ligase [Roseivirga echinicomitans]
MTKQVLREVFLEKRKALTQEEHALRSALVCEQAFKFIKESKNKNIHLFLPLTKQREVNTTPLFEKLIGTSEIQVVLPKVNPNTKELEHFAYTSTTKLIRGSFGVTEPEGGTLFDIKNLDVVFVPLLSFDRKGYRIGYGGGYYDKFFAHASHNLIKVGLAITPPLDHIPYSETHDIPLDFCITHHKIYSF